MNATPIGGGVPSAASVVANPPPPQLAANVACALLMARTEPMADASLPDWRRAKQAGHRDRRDDADDRHHDQQLDEREAPSSLA
jgi:hypothetical protein